jgi:hypothetical protein
MSGALKRTPSPQQIYDGASRTVLGGIAAAGAVVGSALSSIREEDKNAYKDHRTWSEEAEGRASGMSPVPPGGIEMRSASEPGVQPTARAPVGNGKRKTVAIVVSADTTNDDDFDDEGGFYERAVSSPPFTGLADSDYNSLFSPIFLEIPISPRSDCSS